MVDGPAGRGLQTDHAPMALHQGVIVVIASAAHRRHRADLGKTVHIGASCISCPPLKRQMRPGADRDRYAAIVSAAGGSSVRRSSPIAQPTILRVAGPASRWIQPAFARSDVGHVHGNWPIERPPWRDSAARQYAESAMVPR